MDNVIYGQALSHDTSEVIFVFFLELSKALIYSELGGSRDPVKQKIVLENITNLVSQVHG